ncbi:MAG TPA: efflux RND transporter periplasmic adaptor subunit [Gemmatimonadales bacterium]|nr:efflux RND transporter periplasmic adaptor subunit [Gemmatimonadales bacterium]
MKKLTRGLIAAAVAVFVAIGAGSTAYYILRSNGAQANAPAAQAPQATPVSVAFVEQRDVAIWDEFSGRLEAIERVEVRSRVAGAVQSVHFREGALVKRDDLLITIDRAPYAAEVDRLQAQLAAAEARVLLTKSDVERGEQLSGTRVISQREFDQRVNAKSEAEANVKAARAALQSAQLNLDYTQVRAPVAGRVGRLEITVGNLVAAGPGAPVLTTLVSVNPIYASFNADEQVVTRALQTLADQGASTQVERIPVRMSLATNDDTFEGRLQLIDNQVDARSGTVRVRATFDNTAGRLIPGQFARLRMGQPKAEPALMLNERAIGTDQSKKFVLVVNDENKAEYREISLGAAVDTLRVVNSGLKGGERIVVNGLQRVRPGALVVPQLVRMDERSELQAQNTPTSTQR